MNKKSQLYNTKMIETPTTKEIWIYDESILHNFSITKNSLKEGRSVKQFDEMSAIGQYESLKRKQNYYEQMRWVVARLIDCNFDNQTKFLTLTFRKNIEEIHLTNQEFKNFIKRLNYHQYRTKKQRIKYLATWEKQKRGAIHYHIIFFSFPYIKKKELEQLWGHGFVRINKIEVDSKENRGRYVSKYFSKDLELKEHKKKAFFKSQNLKKPLVKKVMLTDEMIDNLAKETIIFTKKYTRQIYNEQVSPSCDESNVPESNLKESKVTYIKIKKDSTKTVSY